MSRLIVIAMLFCFVSCRSTKHQEALPSEDSQFAEPVTVEAFHSLRIPAQRVKIALDTNRKLTIEVQARNKDTKHSNRSLSFDEMSHIQSLLRSIDWDHVANDKVIGLDGTTVRTTYRGITYSAWTPSHDALKRGLTSYTKLKKELFRLAGFNESGMPQ